MDQQTLDTLYALFLAPRTVQSDFARQHAAEVASLASQGLITTKEAPDCYGRLWRITPVGQNSLISYGRL